MNKQELIDAVAADSNLSRAEARRAVDSFIATISKALKKGDRISLIGFGTFSVNKRNARKGRNPQTGKAINIPARKVVRFKPGATLSGSVAGGKSK